MGNVNQPDPGVMGQYISESHWSLVVISALALLQLDAKTTFNRRAEVVGLDAKWNHLAGAAVRVHHCAFHVSLTCNRGIKELSPFTVPLLPLSEAKCFPRAHKRHVVSWLAPIV